jgi:acetyl-CoA synthetase
VDAARDVPRPPGPDTSDIWRRARDELEGLPAGGRNIAYEAVRRHVVAGDGAHTAIRFVDRAGAVSAMTYAELDEAVSRFANLLRTEGIEPGERVVVLAGRIPELYVAVLGSLAARCVVSPLFSAFGPEPILQRMQLADARVLVTTPALYRRKVASIRAQLPGLALVLLAGDGDDEAPEGTRALGPLLAAAEAGFEYEANDPSTPALLHFTSGTTGLPKGAVHVHEAVVVHHATAEWVFELGPQDVYWCTADPGWVTGTSYGIVAPLTRGATLVVDEREFDAERWYGLLESERVTVWYTAPTAIRMLVRAGAELAHGFDLSSLRLAASVGEPLDPGSVRWGADAIGMPFRDTWWQTETGGIMIANTPGLEIRPGSMGRPVPGIEAAILDCDEDGTLRRDPAGGVRFVDDPEQSGMLALRAGWPSMFREYLGAPERYERCFTDGWYLSGDLARRDADGYVWFVGRADDVIKTAGHLIGPFEVERVLLAHPAVAQAGVYGVPDEVAGALVHARIVLRPGTVPPDAGAGATEEILTDVMAHARRHLGPAVAPREIRVLDELPVTRSGKVMRRLLRARELGLPEGDLSTLETGATTETGAST